MGGDGERGYGRDVTTRSTSSSFSVRSVFSLGEYLADEENATMSKALVCNPRLDVYGKDGAKDRICLATALSPKPTLIVIALDDTSSRQGDTEIAYRKSPLIIGQMMMHDYLQGRNAQVCYIFFGDEQFDKIPIQVGTPAGNIELDKDLEAAILEGGGGGNGKESHQLVAYYAARHILWDPAECGEKGILFICTDEPPYEKVSKEMVKKWLGDKIPEDIDSRDIFEELQKRYHVFVIYQKKPDEQKKSGIDEEIRRRVLAAGGMHDGVDIRISLSWNDTNDLDVHVFDPKGDHIYYGSYCRSNGSGPAPSGGFLDVDMNVRGESLKPVENVRWAKGKAPKGHYKVFVQNYNFHQESHKGSEFRVEVQIGDDILHFDRRMPDDAIRGESSTLIYEFDYDPDKINRTPQESADPYAAYREEVILEAWRDVGVDVLICEDPEGIVDVIIGAIAKLAGKSIDDYASDMKERGQTEKRISNTRSALSGMDGVRSSRVVDIGPIPTSGKKRRKTRT